MLRRIGTAAVLAVVVGSAAPARAFTLGEQAATMGIQKTLASTSGPKVAGTINSVKQKVGQVEKSSAAAQSKAWAGAGEFGAAGRGSASAWTTNSGRGGEGSRHSSNAWATASSNGSGSKGWATGGSAKDKN